MASGPGVPVPYRDWADEYARLHGKAAREELSCEELEALATAASMTGHDDEVTALRELAIEQYLAEGDLLSAGKCGFWLGFHLENSGQHARAAGWLARFERLHAANPAALEPLAHVLVMARAAPLMLAGKFSEAAGLFELSRAEALRHGDGDAAVMSAAGLAQCYEGLGRPHDAIVLYDEIMIDVVRKPLAPQLAGLVYCSMVNLCVKYLDFGRAQEWTAALSQWCDAQSGLVPFRGPCAVHQAELLQLKGSWQQAEDVAHELASSQVVSSTTGLAHYRLAELLRLRGRLDAAEQEYRDAARYGCEVQPGLAKLRATQGRLTIAQSGLSRLSGEHAATQPTPAIEAAQIEISVQRGDLRTAQAALGVLNRLASTPGASAYLRGLTAHATGAVLLAQGRPDEALVELRSARSRWSDLDMPYEMARTRALMAGACAAIGDADAAAMERDAACAIFEQLGATVDLAAIRATGRALTDLSQREVEVLRLVAGGATNRAIADRLVISEKTVARHVSNIFRKLGVSNRAAATAYAYRHDLA